MYNIHGPNDSIQGVFPIPTHVPILFLKTEQTTKFSCPCHFTLSAHLRRLYNEV